ncbi:MAG: penicillin-insensitive murein endopeptidase [Pseudomonadota bacterium]
MKRFLSICATASTGVLAAAFTLSFMPFAEAQTPAKRLFGGKKLPAVMEPAVHGFYSKGCVQGAIAIPTDGPNWQAMRLSRNRRWGHPDTIKLVAQLAEDGKKVGWNGLLVGDISQPRGGPMLTGHASHQIGLDADIWLNQMPNKRYTYKQREQTSAVSMLRRTANGLDQTKISKKTFNKATFGIIKTAASYKRVERVLVHPTIKAELCRMETGDRRWLYKVRPYWGHHYHMHVRLSCPAGSPNCRPQAKPAANDGCGAELKYWANLLKPPKRVKKKTVAKKKKKPVKVAKKRELRLGDLPQACRVVLKAPAPVNAQAATLTLTDGQAFVPTPVASRAASAADALVADSVTVPTFRPRP